MPIAGWTGIIGAGLHVYLAARARKLADQRYWARNARAVQASQLRSLLARASSTAFGRQHGFARLAAIPSDADLLAAYRQAVPVSEYPAYRAWLERMRDDAEPDVAWPGVVMDWAQTSGTTAGDKFIPVSQDMMRSNFRTSLDIFAHGMNNGVSLRRVFTGKALFMGGSTDLSINRHGMRTGDLSGIVTPLIRWPISEVYLPGPQIALMSDWTAKIDAMARLCLTKDVRALSGMASWSLVLFNRVVELARQSRRDVRCLRDVWPNFDLFIHGGVKYAPFDPRVREAWSGAREGPGSDIPHRVEVYPASEGFVAIQDTAGDPGLRLNADHGVFFDFVPLDDYTEGAPPAHDAGEVQKGVRYVVVLTTCAGLWRYTLGDVVEFDSVPPDGPPRLRIVGRHRHFINAFGENLIVENIETGVAAAAAASGLTVGEFSAAPVYPDASAGVKAGLELAVEINTARPSADAVRAFASAFDASLKATCVDYGIKRKDDLGMAPPTVTVLPPGAFHRWMASRGKLGGQHKCPRCANHRDILDAVIRAEIPARAAAIPAASSH